MAAPEPPSREAVIEAVVTQRHLDAAHAEQRRLDQFCAALDLPLTTDAVSLYLAAMAAEPETARSIRRSLASLDLAARLAGRKPWSSDPALRYFLRGLHRDIRIGPTNQRADPLYRELVDRIVTVVMTPTAMQAHDQAAFAIRHTTAIHASVLATLTWDDITIRRESVTLRLGTTSRTVSPSVEITLGATGERWCPVATTRRLRTARSPRRGPVFSKNGQPWDVARLNRATAGLKAVPDIGIDAAFGSLATSPRQLRDRAVILLGYGAALRTTEAINLTIADITTHQHGLLIRIPGRANPVGLPAAPGARDDPVRAWQAWTQTASDLDRGAPNDPAFPIVSGTRVWDRPVREAGLNALVQEAAARARLDGQYTFTSLRTGLIRTALRADRAAVDIAAHSDLGSLTSVARHDHRENLIRRSVAGRLGL